VVTEHGLLDQRSCILRVSLVKQQFLLVFSKLVQQILPFTLELGLQVKDFNLLPSNNILGALEVLVLGFDLILWTSFHSISEY
jgi:hypothetical protein